MLLAEDQGVDFSSPVSESPNPRGIFDRQDTSLPIKVSESRKAKVADSPHN